MYLTLDNTQLVWFFFFIQVSRYTLYNAFYAFQFSKSLTSGTDSSRPQTRSDLYFDIRYGFKPAKGASDLDLWRRYVPDQSRCASGDRTGSFPELMISPRRIRSGVLLLSGRRGQCNRLKRWWRLFIHKMNIVPPKVYALTFIYCAIKCLDVIAALAHSLSAHSGWNEYNKIIFYTVKQPFCRCSLKLLAVEW